MSKRGPYRPPEPLPPPDPDRTEVIEPSDAWMKVAEPTAFDQKVGTIIAGIFVALVILICASLSIALSISAIREAVL